MYAGRVACCFLVNHGEYADETEGRTDRQTDRQTNDRPLSPVYTRNNVEATFDFVEATFVFVAKKSNNVERVYRKMLSSFRQSQMLLRHCCRFLQQCRKGESMVSGALGKISKLCLHMFFVMQIRVIFALPFPL